MFYFYFQILKDGIQLYRTI